MNTAPITIKNINFYFPPHPVKDLELPAGERRVGTFYGIPTPNLRPGQLWEEQGGVVAGIMPAEGDAPAYYLIVPADPAAEADNLAWGNYGTEVAGLDARDGLKNTAVLNASGGHPAAEFCALLQIDGFDDYYLPSRREASLMAATVPHLFKSGYHWTSTQFSAYCAFVQDFSDGGQASYAKRNAWRVRAVRRFLID